MGFNHGILLMRVNTFEVLWGNTHKKRLGKP